jgi:hypothetical protein
MSALGEYLPVLAEFRENLAVVRYRFANSDPLWESIRQAAMISPANLIGIMRVLGLEHWLRDGVAVFSRAGCALAPAGATGTIATNDLSAAAHAS